MIMWEYIAGVTDSEGSIGIIWRHRGFSKLRPLGYLDPYVHISMCSEPTIRYIQKAAQLGQVYKENRKTKNQYNSFLFSLGKTSDILVFLLQVEPYLIAKKQLAYLLIEFCANRLVAPRGTKRASSYSTRDWQIYFEQLFLQMKHNQSTIQLLKSLKELPMDRSFLPVSLDSFLQSSDFLLLANRLTPM